MAKFTIIHEVKEHNRENDWCLCFQWGKWEADEDFAETYFGYRFIQRKPDGNLRPARGQARIQSFSIIFDLLLKAWADGWLIKCETQNMAFQIFEKFRGLNMRINKNGHDIRSDVQNTFERVRDEFKKRPVVLDIEKFKPMGKIKYCCSHQFERCESCKKEREALDRMRM